MRSANKIAKKKKEAREITIESSTFDENDALNRCVNIYLITVRGIITRQDFPLPDLLVASDNLMTTKDDEGGISTKAPLGSIRAIVMVIRHWMVRAIIEVGEAQLYSRLYLFNAAASER